MTHSNSDRIWFDENLNSDRCLIGGNKRSGFMGGEGRSVIIMINPVSYIGCYD